MAEGGGDFGYVDPDLDVAIDKDDEQPVIVPSEDEEDVLAKKQHERLFR